MQEHTWVTAALLILVISTRDESFIIAVFVEL